MSIFKDTFPKEIKNQIERRQNLLEERKPKHLSYLNSRKAWVRLSSGVNILDNTPSGSNTLARQYALQGGTLNDITLSNTSSYGGALRQGVGSDSSKAYSTTTPSGKTHDLGIRPMPGITNVDIKSKSAYGSLREATINFVCWDIRQLEDLELLYMRPGFTVLLEWGWSPYIDNSDNYVTTVTTYDNFLLGKLPTGNNALQDIYKYLHVTKSLQESNGNYDAMIGRIQNFQWSFRADGGYDCQTTIISFGEVLESLKVNYSVFNISTSDKTTGFLGVGPSLTTTDAVAWRKNFPKVYDKSKLSGILYELSAYLANNLNNKSDKSTVGNDYRNTFIGGSLYNLFALNLKTTSENQSTSDKNSVINLPLSDTYQYYITLGSLCDLLNKYILVSSDKGNIVSVSTKNREYIAQSAAPTQTSTPKKPSPPPPPPKQPPPPSGFFEKLGNFISEAAGSIGSAVGSATQAVANYANKIDPNSLDKLNSTSLFCLTHPLQISVDPSVCLINSPVWRNGFSFPKVSENVNENTPGAVDRTSGNGNVAYSNEAKRIVQRMIDYALDGGGDPFKNQTYNELVTYLTKPDQQKALEELIIQYEILRGGKEIISVGQGGGSSTVPKGLISTGNKKYASRYSNFPSFGSFSKQPAEVNWKGIFTLLQLPETTQKTYDDLISNVDFTNISKNIQEVEETNEASQEATEGSKTNLKFLNDLLPFFKDDKGGNTQQSFSGLGYISNIYVNINYLYQLSLNQNLESLDKKEKNEINLYDYLKTIMGSIQTSTGNVNNFDIHVDPIDNIGRIIDINFTSENPGSEFDKAVVIEIQGTKTTATNVSLRSQIFPEQSSIVAISAQNGGGTLGLDNTTLVGFNRGIRDRIIPEKFAPKAGIVPPTDPNAQLVNLKESIGSLASFFNDLRAQYTDSWFSRDVVPSYNSSNAGEYKNALKDLINNIKAIFNDPNEFKSIIPTKLSITMDGLGGIVIGNIFRIPENRLPAGYKGDGVGRKLGYIVTGLSHKIDTRFWETTIDAQTIILENNTNKKGFDYKNIIIPDPDNPGGFKLRSGNDVPSNPPNVGENGNLPDEALKSIGIGSLRLATEAADAFLRMAAAAREEGIILKVTDAYRTFETQDRIFDWDLYVSTGGNRTDTKNNFNKKALRKKKGSNGKTAVAFPGTSNHGWGKAIDAEGRETKKFIRNNGVKYGWSWYEGRAAGEDWHFTYDPTKKDIWPLK